MGLTIEEAQEKLKFFNDNKFKFDEPSHSYTYNGEKMFGVTSFLENFVKPFDEDHWSKKKANDRSITQEEILAEWKATRDRACELGHRVHTYIETFYENDKPTIPKEDPEALERIQKFHAIYESRLNKLEDVGSEIRVFHNRWKLAGTMDKLYYYKGEFIVGDWKTNKEIKDDKSFCFDKLLYPFENLKSNEINKYSLQISLYRLMLEEAGIPTAYGFICHIPGKDKAAEIYKLKDFRQELRYYLDNKWMMDGAVEVKKIKSGPTIEKLW